MLLNKQAPGQSDLTDFSQLHDVYGRKKRLPGHKEAKIIWTLPVS